MAVGDRTQLFRRRDPQDIQKSPDGSIIGFETNLKRERQLAGIAAAKANGKHLGNDHSL